MSDRLVSDKIRKLFTEIIRQLKGVIYVNFFGSRSNHGVLMTGTYWYVSLKQVGGGLTEVMTVASRGDGNRLNNQLSGLFIMFLKNFLLKLPQRACKDDIRVLAYARVD